MPLQKIYNDGIRAALAHFKMANMGLGGIPKIPAVAATAPMPAPAPAPAPATGGFRGGGGQFGGAGSTGRW